eukprot:SRR837773.28156.p4 GENE.SRR837773.28156~~SRR837773.28156.p4  ORF type:complete len:160 (+),score=76.14 SRR837773.28156:67-480(+)
MKASMKKAAAMKSSKVMKRKTGMKGMKKAMKAMKARKAMKKSTIAKGKLAKAVVFRGTKAKTSSGLTKSELMRNKNGKIVSKKQHAAGRKLWEKSGAKAWAMAVKAARKALAIKGFCPVGGKSAAGKALYAKAKSLL